MATSITCEAQRNQTSILIRAEKITFPPNPDGQTDIQTEGRTDISIYRVASLLKRIHRSMEPLYENVQIYLFLE